MRNAKPTVNPTNISTGIANANPSGYENCLPIGTRLADFEITGIVGEGGFGIVYLAFDHSLRRTVAIKEYMPGALAGRGADKSVVVRSERHQETFETGLKSFINEARLLARFDHPALVKVYRFWEENKTGYMAMRYYEGETLKSVVKSHPELITEAWLKSMLKPILEALDALYKVQILHRDISPDNVMIQRNGDAVLLDFGAARQIIGDMTHALTVILKPGYAPIEQYADDTSMTQGPWTDIYALSAVVYYAIVKTPPPTSVGRMIKDPIVSLQQSALEGYSAEFLAAINQGLAVKPEDRPQSIAEFRKLLGFHTVVPLHVEPLPLSVVPHSVSALSAQAESLDSSPYATTVALGKTIVFPEKNTVSRVRTRLKTHMANRRSWALVVTGVLLITLFGAYRAFKGKPVPVDTQPAMSAVSQTVAAASGKSIADRPVEAPNPPLPGTTVTVQENTKTDLNTAADPAEKPVGLVKLTIKPWGTVLVDGQSKGVSPPLKKLRLPEGKHQFKIVNPNFPDYVIEVDVNAKKSGNIEYDFAPTSKTNNTR
jgi:serine/threonine protein kinase